MRMVLFQFLPGYQPLGFASCREDESGSRALPGLEAPLASAIWGLLHLGVVCGAALNV